MISVDYDSEKDIDSQMRLVRKVSGSCPGLETEEALTEEFGSPVQELVRKAVGALTGEVNCPCKKTKCERHGNCDVCRAYHTGSKRKRPCERTKNSRT